MFKHLWKSLAFAGVLALAPSLGSAQLPPLPPLPPLPGLEIRIGHTSPPRMRRESRPPRPGAGFTWVRGSWDWQSSQWVWIDGRWDRPERPGIRWIAARYAREGDGWRYEPGHWSHQKVVEGDDYRSWRDGHRERRGRDRDRNHDHGHR
jgi:hypothetical protein